MAIPHDLRVQLRERRNRLHKSDYQRYPSELAIFLEWLDRYEYLRGIISEIEAASFDFEAWKDAGGLSRGGIKYPDREVDRAKLCLMILRAEEVETYVHALSNKTNYNEMFAEFTEIIVNPLVEYIEDRIEDGSAVLSTLLRYKRRVEWFEASDLFSLYEGDTGRGEALLDAHLRRYLLDQGIDFPLSQPRSPSGEVDVLAGLGTDDPLSLEVKLYSPEAGKDQAYVRQGFAQAYRYASDYSVPAGYLLVFNLTTDALVFEVDSPRKGSPPAIHHGDKTIFLVPVHTHPDRPTASKDPKLARTVITEAYLLDEIA